MRKSRTVIQEPVNEKSTPVYKTVLKDENKSAIASGDLTSLTLTLYNEDDDAIINNRNAQDVLNANNVTVDSSGNLEWKIQTADTAIQGSGIGTNEIENHIALFHYKWDSGNQEDYHEVVLPIINLNKVS